MDGSLSWITFNLFGNFKSLLVLNLTLNELSKTKISFIGCRQSIFRAYFFRNGRQFILRDTITLEDISDGLLGSKGRVSDNLRSMDTTITVTNITNKLRAIDIWNININIWHGVAFTIQETLKDKIFSYRINSSNI